VSRAFSDIGAGFSGAPPPGAPPPSARPADADAAGSGWRYALYAKDSIVIPSKEPPNTALTRLKYISSVHPLIKYVMGSTGRFVLRLQRMFEVVPGLTYRVTITSPARDIKDIVIKTMKRQVMSKKKVAVTLAGINTLATADTPAQQEMTTEHGVQIHPPQFYFQVTQKTYIEIRVRLEISRKSREPDRIEVDFYNTAHDARDPRNLLI
jgi:hypothetical protein